MSSGSVEFKILISKTCVPKEHVNFHLIGRPWSLNAESSSNFLILPTLQTTFNRLNFKKSAKIGQLFVELNSS